MPKTAQNVLVLTLIAAFAFPASSDAGWGLFKCFRTKPVKTCPPVACSPAPCAIVVKEEIKTVKYKAIGYGYDGSTMMPCVKTGECCSTPAGAIGCLQSSADGCMFTTIRVERCTDDTSINLCCSTAPVPPDGLEWAAFYVNDSGMTVAYNDEFRDDFTVLVDEIWESESSRGSRGYTFVSKATVADTQTDQPEVQTAN